MSASPKLADSLDLGPVHITVTDLDRSVGFYQDAIGLQIRERGDSEASLSAGGEKLLRLVENREAKPAGRHAGLYHFALLHPSRAELARAAASLAATRTAISGASDHGISEAIYLPDPDGNGIELAADPPSRSLGRSERPRPRSGPSRWTSRRCCPRWPGMSPGPTQIPRWPSAICTCTWETWTRASASTAT